MAKSKTKSAKAAAGDTGVGFLTGSVPLGPRLFNFGARIINTGEMLMPASPFNQKFMQEPGRRAPLLQPLPINHDAEAIAVGNDARFQEKALRKGGHIIQRNTRFMTHGVGRARYGR